LRQRGADHLACACVDPLRAHAAASRRPRQRHFRAGAHGVQTLAERLAAEGYDTAAVVSAIVLARRHGLDQGFRIYDDDLASGVSAGTAVEERQAEATTAAALATIAGLRPPYFLWVHYYDPHEEYRPPSRFAAAARGPHRLYDGEIAYMDSEIGRLLAALPERRWWRRSAITARCSASTAS
jgi:arylsulfatase A-like enzyme